MKNRKRVLAINYEFSQLLDVEDRTAMAFDIPLDEIEQILKEE